MKSRFMCLKISMSIILLVIPLLGAMTIEEARGFSPQIIQHGATGEDVVELQSRLQYLGFYNGNIDGVFGWGTYWALRNFQYEFGLEVDGLAGFTTKKKLADASKYNESYVKKQIRKGKDFTHYGGQPLDKQTEESKKGKSQAPADQGKSAPKKQQQQNTKKGKNVPSGYSENDIQLMANAVYGEARGEPYVGQVAVAAVIINRIESTSFPNTISGVIFEPGAFTAVADGQIWLTPNEKAKKAVQDALNGWDPTDGSIYYFNPNTATSGWIWTRNQVTQIGKHIFAK
ncbi:spore cortex-lytic enzyme [Pseudalkalibacillus berkeleyi]|uniref:Spore cortex-lytic enzyme n=1 Tax=Pseudalkalibacillus berkeleyi TaxID=1069813 RepID=A0ABS9H193_9BACL|nr:spore cortex-lytic enzyme [Pseudalkalibacillus berkeleyi]MCF6137598.1 spore cortex-lytic enzyme [Pseudalkalibacillus berkeleyi]